MQNFPFDDYLARINEWLDTYLFTFDSALQAIVVLGAAIGGFILGKALKNRFAEWINHLEASSLTKALLHIFRRVVTPFFMIILILIAGKVLEIIGYSAGVAIIAIKLLVAWIMIKLMVQFIGNKLAQNIFAITIWIIAALSIFGVLDDVSGTLSASGFSMGKFKITALGVVKGLLALGAMIYGSLALANFLDSRLSKTALNSASRVLIGKIVRIFLIASALLIAITTAGVDLSVLAVFSGAVGLGIGFGLQRGFANMFSGMMLLVDQSIKPGDIIEVPTADGRGSTFGWIQHMGGRHTEIITRENKSHLIPNEFLISQQVINWTRGDTLVRMEVKFGVHYDSDPHFVKKVAEDAALKPERVQKDVTPACHLIEFGDSELKFSLRFWIRDAERGVTNIKGEVMLALWDAFKANGIKIPYPHHEVFIHQQDPNPTNRKGA